MSFTAMFFAFLFGGAVLAFLAARFMRFPDFAVILGIGIATMVGMIPIFWMDRGGYAVLVATVPFIFTASLGAVVGCTLNRKLAAKSE